MPLKSVLFLALSIRFSVFAFANGDPKSPAESPPSLSPLGQPQEEERLRLFSDHVPTLEWELHKTEDGAHPDGNEQQLVWLMNRARTNPAFEGSYLADTGHAIVPLAVAEFTVDLEVMKSEFWEIVPRPPVAFDRRIYEGSRVHSEDLIVRDAQDHANQFDRMTDAGFVANGANASVFSYAFDAVHAHAAFNIDWGNDGGDGTGMQPFRGHRDGIMGITLATTNVGIAMVEENDDNTEAGPLVTSAIYARAYGIVENHYNRFLVGTVWEDENSNGQYDPGEGLGGVTVLPYRGTFYAVTADSGGWALPATETGAYAIEFSGGDLEEAEQREVEVAGTSVLVLWNESDSHPQPEEAIVSIVNLNTESEVSWTAEEGHMYRVQVSSSLESWTDDDRAIEADGDLRRVSFADEELEGALFVRIISIRTE